MLTNSEVFEKYVQPTDKVNIHHTPFQNSTHEKDDKFLDFQQNPNLNAWPKYKKLLFKLLLKFLEFDWLYCQEILK